MHHTQKQRKIKFKPRIKLNHNIYTVDYLLLHLFTTNIVCIIKHCSHFLFSHWLLEPTVNYGNQVTLAD